MTRGCPFKLCSRMCLLATSWTVPRQAPLSMGFFQARILEWVAIASSRGSSRPRDQTRVSCGSCTGREILYHWAIVGSPTMPSEAGNAGFGMQCPNQAAGSASEQVMVAPWENAWSKAISGGLGMIPGQVRHMVLLSIFGSFPTPHFPCSQFP